MLKRFFRLLFVAGLCFAFFLSAVPVPRAAALTMIVVGAIGLIHYFLHARAMPPCDCPEHDA